MKKFMHLYSVSDKYYLFKRLLIMKLTLLFLLFFNIVAFADVYSQTKISVNFKDTDLKQVLRTIERKSNYRFAYSERKIPVDKKVTIIANNETVTDVLDKVLSDFNLIYKDQGNNLLAISTPDKMAEYLAEQQQPIKVTGLVTDISTGETLIGATIKVKGTTNAVSVDVAGKFTIDAPNAQAVLVANYIGYTELEIPLAGKTVLDIKLSKVTQNLDEVVVTGFGLTTRKATLAGAISTVTADELSHSRSATASGALVGRVPGINFRQTNGRPGSAPDIQIRNFGTPLIIIDGITRDYTNFSNMDFNDIESISVLKDGSAAIYGMLAANGVVVITTKKGKRGQKPTVSYQNYYGLQKVANYNKPADAKTFIKAIVQDETFNNRTRTITREEYDKWMNESDEDHKGFDWYDYIWGSAAPQIYNSLNFSGGSENTDYYVSVSNLQQKPTMRNMGDGFKRTNFQTNVNANISKFIKVGVNISGRLEEMAQAGLPGDDYGFAEQTAFRNLPTMRPYANNNLAYPGVSAIDQQYSFGWIGYETSGKWVQTRTAVTLNGFIEAQLLPGLKARLLGNYSFTNTQVDQHEKSPVLYTYNKATDKYSLAPNLPEARYIERNFTNRREMTTNFQLDYKKSFGDHNFQAVVGVEARSNIQPNLNAVGSPAANGIAFIPNASVITAFTDNIGYWQKRQNYSTKINYDYKGKYIAEFVGRYDGSFNYIDGRRWGFFPGGSVAYRVSEEGFWKNSSLLSNVNDFKLRASYGVLGQELGGDLSYIAGYNYNQGVAILDGKEIISTRIAGLPTVNVTWGRVHSINIGADITLLNNRLSGSFEWFQRKQTGLLAGRVDVLLPDLVGFARPNENLNTDYIRGIEFSANWRDKIGQFNYFFGGNFTFSRAITGYRYKQNERWTSEWARYRGGPNNDEGRYRDGTMQLIGAGQFQSWEEIRNWPIEQDHEGNRTIRPGDYKFEDINGDGFINDLDMKTVTYRINNGTPWINFAFNVGANYKGFDFRADFAGATGQTYEQQGYMRYFDANQNVSQYLADNSTWYNDIWDRNSGFNIGKYPLLTRGANNWMTTHWPNSHWQVNLTYVKLRNLEIGYTIPYNVLKSVGISNFRVYLAGQNVAQISNMPGGLDPEITSSGGNSYPNPRVYTMGVQVKF